MIENFLLRLDFCQLGAKGVILKTFEKHNFGENPVLAFIIYCSFFVLTIQAGNTFVNFKLENPLKTSFCNFWLLDGIENT